MGLDLRQPGANGLSRRGLQGKRLCRIEQSSQHVWNEDRSRAQKLDATAAVVNGMIAQRRTMRDGTMKMQHGMLGRMMDHIQAGRDSMGMCATMTQLAGMMH